MTQNERLRRMIPQEVLDPLLDQDLCELDYDFLCFADVYAAVADVIPKNFIVVDFGCYMGAQAYFFQEHRGYIGIDDFDDWWAQGTQRFSTWNTTMVTGRIEDVVPVIADASYIFAICSYVPDEKAQQMVAEKYQNHLVFYPSGINDIVGVNAGKLREVFDRYHEEALGKMQ